MGEIELSIHSFVDKTLTSCNLGNLLTAFHCKCYLCTQKNITSQGYFHIQYPTHVILSYTLYTYNVLISIIKDSTFYLFYSLLHFTLYSFALIIRRTKFYSAKKNLCYKAQIGYAFLVPVMVDMCAYS